MIALVKKAMGSITVRKLDDDLKQRLRQRAARHGRSMEDEVREVLRITLATDAGEPENLAERIQARFALLGGVELELPEREPARKPPEF